MDDAYTHADAVTISASCFLHTRSVEYYGYHGIHAAATCKASGSRESGSIDSCAVTISTQIYVWPVVGSEL